MGGGRFFNYMLMSFKNGSPYFTGKLNLVVFLFFLFKPRNFGKII